MVFSVSLHYYKHPTSIVALDTSCEVSGNDYKGYVSKEIGATSLGECNKILWFYQLSC